jgi:hypothetical protein
MATSLRDTDSIVASLEAFLGGVIHLMSIAFYLLIWDISGWRPGWGGVGGRWVVSRLLCGGVQYWARAQARHAVQYWARAQARHAVQYWARAQARHAVQYWARAQARHAVASNPAAPQT